MTIRNLKKGETLRDIIPEIIQAYVENPDESVITFEGFGISFAISWFDLEAGQMMGDTTNRDLYLLLLLHRQKYESFDKPYSMATLWEETIKATQESGVNQYLARFVDRSIPTISF